MFCAECPIRHQKGTQETGSLFQLLTVMKSLRSQLLYCKTENTLIDHLNVASGHPFQMELVPFLPSRKMVVLLYSDYLIFLRGNGGVMRRKKKLIS